MVEYKPTPTEPFTWVFAAVVVIFFVLFLLFGSEPLEDGGGDGTDIPDAGEIIFSVNYVNLLSNKTQSVRTVDFGDFDVGYVSNDRVIQDIGTLCIEKGIFKSSSKEFSFDGNGMESAVLEFSVDDFNDYGNLMVYFNGDVVYDNMTLKGAKYKIEFNNLVDHNNVRIEAQSSGVWFWAPTTYVLSGVKLSASSFDNMDKMFSFGVYDYEMTGFDAVFSYEVGSGSVRQGDMHIEINGNEVNTQKKPMFGRIYRETFTRVDGVIAAKPDSNYIRFYADGKGMYEIRDALMTISYFDSDRAAVSEHAIFIDDKTYDKMYNKTVVLEFYAEKVSSDRPFEIYLNDRILEHDTELYENQIIISQDRFRKDKTNTLKFSTYGIYKLSDVDIRIADDSNSFSLF